VTSIAGCHQTGLTIIILRFQICSGCTQQEHNLSMTLAARHLALRSGWRLALLRHKVAFKIPLNFARILM